MDVMLLQNEKAESPIVVMLDRVPTDGNNLHEKKALSPMTVTLDRLLMDGRL